MITEVWVVLEGRKPLNENVGRDLNTFRIAILDGILNDSQLEVIVNARGGGLLRYESMMTDMAEGLTMEGKLGIKLFARYPLIPAEFKL
jgi:hypothetical protein